MHFKSRCEHTLGHLHLLGTAVFAHVDTYANIHVHIHTYRRMFHCTNLLFSCLLKLFRERADVVNVVWDFIHATVVFECSLNVLNMYRCNKCLTLDIQ